MPDNLEAFEETHYKHQDSRSLDWILKLPVTNPDFLNTELVHLIEGLRKATKY